MSRLQKLKSVTMLSTFMRNSSYIYTIGDNDIIGLEWQPPLPDGRGYVDVFYIDKIQRVYGTVLEVVWDLVPFKKEDKK